MGAADLLRQLKSVGLTVSAECDRLTVRPRELLTDAHRQVIRAHRDELMEVLRVGSAKEPLPCWSPLGQVADSTVSDLTKPDPMERDQFDRRVVHLQRRGLALERAQRLARTLQRRDQEGTDLRMCLECTHLGDRGRCIAASIGRLPGVDRRLEPVPDLLQRCEAFGLREGLE